MAINSIKQELLTAERLRELLHYNPDTGEFTWLKGNQGAKLGAVAGTSYGKERRRRICIDYAQHSSHRLAWLYVHGKWPDKVIDHINGIPYDNRIANLRDVDMSANLCNQRRAKSHNASGVLGVRAHKNRFTASISIRGENHFLGSFNTAEDAHAAYMFAKNRLHGLPYACFDHSAQHPTKRTLSDSTESGIPGIRRTVRGKGVIRWVAHRYAGNKTFYIGSYDTKELAVEARNKALTERLNQ